MADIATAVANQEIPSPPAPAKSSTKTSVLIGAILILLIAVGGTAWWIMGRSKKAPSKAKAETAQIKTVLHLNSFLVNLADPEENRFLRIEIDLGLEHEIGKGEAEAASPPTPRIRDKILTVLMTWRSDALLTPEGKAKLKAELVHALRERTPELGDGQIVGRGEFDVVGGNYIVGFVLILALIAIQYVVITHGAIRIAEVTARFHLRRILEPFLPKVAVLSPVEISALVPIQSLGVVR